MGFRAGDGVYIASIDEKWVLACDEENGEVICAGWPESLIAATKCELKRAQPMRNVKRCSEALHARALIKCAAVGPRAN